MHIIDLATHPKQYVTLADYADYLDVKLRTMYRHVEVGALKAVKVGGLLRIPIEEARRFASVPARND